MDDLQHARGEIDPRHPLIAFAADHRQILAQLEALEHLPALPPRDPRAVAIAVDTLALFETEVLRHHREEEIELFPAVLRSAASGAEAAHVQRRRDRLVLEHAVIEARWAALRPQIERLAAGKPSRLDARIVRRLVHNYRRHARIEEQEFLPLAHAILSRNLSHVAALGMALQMGRIESIDAAG